MTSDGRATGCQHRRRAGSVLASGRLMTAHPGARRALASRRARRAGAATVRRMILDRFTVTDQVAIVTGSGRGIGAATAVALAEAGADLVLAARTEEQLRQVAARIEGLGRRAVVVVGDLSDVDVMASLAATARDQ